MDTPAPRRVLFLAAPETLRRTTIMVFRVLLAAVAAATAGAVDVSSP